MSDVKEVGVVGQEYEERTSGKRGVLDSRDEQRKTLMLIDSDGKGFNVSYSSFRSRWRKVASVSELVTGPEFIEEESVEETDVPQSLSDLYELVGNACVMSTDDNFICMIWRNEFKSEHCIIVNDNELPVLTFTNELLEYFNPEDFGAEQIDKSMYAITYSIAMSKVTSIISAVIEAINRR